MWHFVYGRINIGKYIVGTYIVYVFLYVLSLLLHTRNRLNYLFKYYVNNLVCLTVYIINVLYLFLENRQQIKIMTHISCLRIEMANS